MKRYRQDPAKIQRNGEFWQHRPVTMEHKATITSLCNQTPQSAESTRQSPEEHTTLNDNKLFITLKTF